MSNLAVEVTEDEYVFRLEKYNLDDITFCRKLQGSCYHPKKDNWTAARNVPNAIDLNASGLFKDKKILSLMTAPSGAVFRLEYEWKIILPSSKRYFDHQLEWAKWCAEQPRSMCIAEMGLGKTLMSMLWWKAHGIAPKRILVVCPNSLIFNWEAEIKLFTGEESIPVTGDRKAKEKKERLNGLHIISYDTFQAMLKVEKINGRAALPPWFKDKTCVVLDESHKIKNPSALRSKALNLYCNVNTRTHVLCLTGTPISQGAQDYYSQFRVIRPELLGSSYTAFRNRYLICEQIRNAPIGVTRIIGYKKLEELTALVAPYSQTYLKKDCLDLPPKSYAVRQALLSSEQRKMYNSLKHEMALWVKEAKEPLTAQNILTRMIRLCQVVQGFVPQPGKEGQYYFCKENPKLDALEDFIDELPPKEPFVVVCRFLPDIQVVSTLLSKFKIPYGTIYGDVDPKERHKIIQDFQAGQYRAVIGQVATIGTGFNITRASNMVFYSNDYSLTNREQAEDRIHRIGTEGTVLYTDIVAVNTIDEDILKALRGKKDLAAELTQMRMFEMD